jgi:hypothetical protein
MAKYTQTQIKHIISRLDEATYAHTMKFNGMGFVVYNGVDKVSEIYDGIKSGKVVVGRVGNSSHMMDGFVMKADAARNKTASDALDKQKDDVAKMRDECKRIHDALIFGDSNASEMIAAFDKFVASL